MNELPIILYYILGALITSSFLVIWFGTTIAVHLSKFFRVLGKDSDVSI